MSLKLIICIIAVSIVIIILSGQIDYLSPNYLQWDMHEYLGMAKAFPKIDRAISLPFAYRILGPWMVGLLPIPEEIGFHILAIIASLSLAIIFPLFLIKSGISPPSATLAAIFFVCNKHFFGLPVWNYFQLDDILLLIGITIIFDAAPKNKWLIFACTLLIGSLAKETILIVLPTFLIYLIEYGLLRKYWAIFLTAIFPTIVVFISLREIIQAPGVGLIEAMLIHMGKLTSPGTIYGLFINSFAPFSLLPIIFWKRTVLFFSRRKYILVYFFMVFVSALFGSNNERLIAPAFIGFYWLIAEIIQNDIYPDKLMIIIFTALAFVSSFNYKVEFIQLPSSIPFMVIPFASQCLLTLLALARKRKMIGRYNLH